MVRLVLHGPGQPGMGLLLIGVLGLVVLLGEIGLISRRPWSAPYPRHSRGNADRSTRGAWSRRSRVQRRQRLDGEPPVDVGPRCDHR